METDVKPKPSLTASTSTIVDNQYCTNCLCVNISCSPDLSNRSYFVGTSVNTNPSVYLQS